eukprot:19250-Heterococcus_DN1.PRE.4
MQCTTACTRVPVYRCSAVNRTSLQCTDPHPKKLALKQSLLPSISVAGLSYCDAITTSDIETSKRTLSTSYCVKNVYTN